MSGADGRGRWDGRHRAREAALRALYQMTVGHLDPATAASLAPTLGDEDAIPLDDQDAAFAGRLAVGAWEARVALDAIIEPLCTNWRLDRLNVVDHLVLRLADPRMAHRAVHPPAGGAERGARPGPRLQRREPPCGS